MIVDLILGMIFITAIICFTIYKINKNSVKGRQDYFTKDSSSEDLKDTLRDIAENNVKTSKSDVQIGFELKKGKEVLKKDDPNDKN